MNYQWARPLRPHTGKIRQIVLHCSDSGPAATAEDIHQWHLKRGWAGIAYHWVISADGTITRGRPEPMQGAGAAGHNDCTLHVCMIGDFDEAAPGKVQWAATIRHLAAMCKRLGLGAADVTFHRELNGGKTCPGKVLSLPLTVAAVRDVLVEM